MLSGRAQKNCPSFAVRQTDGQTDTQAHTHTLFLVALPCSRYVQHTQRINPPRLTAMVDTAAPTVEERKEER
jgi:hypothetical protein